MMKYERVTNLYNVLSETQQMVANQLALNQFDKPVIKRLSCLQLFELVLASVPSPRKVPKKDPRDMGRTNTEN